MLGRAFAHNLSTTLCAYSYPHFNRDLEYYENNELPCRKLTGRRKADSTRFLVRTPLVTFWITWVCDVCLAIGLTLLPTSALNLVAEQQPWLISVLLYWLCSNALWELNLLRSRESDWSTSIVDPFKWIDLLSLILTIIGTLIRLIVTELNGDHDLPHRDLDVASSTTGRVASAFLATGVLLFWLRTLRLTLINYQWGAYVLMVFTMLVRDVVKFIVFQLVFTFAFSAAAQKIYEPAGDPASWTDLTKTGSLRMFPEWAAESDSYAQCDVEFSTWPRAFVMLFEGGFTGSSYFDCAGRSTKPWEGTVLMYFYHLFSVVLLLNMLSACKNATPHIHA